MPTPNIRKIPNFYPTPAVALGDAKRDTSKPVDRKNMIEDAVRLAHRDFDAVFERLSKE